MSTKPRPAAAPDAGAHDSVYHSPANNPEPLPHERDEAVDASDTAGGRDLGPRQVIEQAARDIGRGLRDTDRHGVPSDVPGPGPAPSESPGAEVPPEGVSRKNYSRRQAGKG